MVGQKLLLTVTVQSCGAVSWAAAVKSRAPGTGKSHLPGGTCDQQRESTEMAPASFSNATGEVKMPLASLCPGEYPGRLQPL